jgi:uncharacterized protein with HEPN domain
VTPDERLRDALEDLIEYCELAADLVASGREAFLDDRVAQLASEAVLNRIGDTAQHALPEGFRRAHPEIPWSKIIGMRVRVAHIYQRLSYERVWIVLAEDIPALGHRLVEVLAQLPSES